jgi:hypothetical protein
MSDPGEFPRGLTTPEPPDTESEPPSFGQRMQALKRARGLPPQVGGGRKPLAEKYKRQIAAVERTFADALPQLAQQYVAELQPADPERCPQHHLVLRCPAKGCEHESERTAFEFRAVQYAFDRLLGRPTTHVEASVQARFVEELTVTLVSIFEGVNAYDSATIRRQAFAEACRNLITTFGSGAG